MYSENKANSSRNVLKKQYEKAMETLDKSSDTEQNEAGSQLKEVLK